MTLLSAVRLRFRATFILPALLCGASFANAQLHPVGSTPVANPAGADQSGKPRYASHVVTSETVGHMVDIDVDLTGAAKLYLVVTDGGNGFATDWADWVEPTLIGEFGEKKLTELPWVSATSEWKTPNVDKNVDGKSIVVNNQPIANGIGTHANSIIEYNLPKGTTRLKTRAGLDKGGVDQNGGTSVAFQIWTTPPPNAVGKNSGAGGARTPEDALAALDVADGLEAATFAAEPLLLSPSSIDIDSKGRVWVAEIVNYRGHNGKRPEGDRVLILEDVNGDGKADKQTVFYQDKDFKSPHGVCVLGNQCIVSVGDKVIRLTDSDGDDKADKTEIMFTGIKGAQHDHGIHAFHFGPDGKLYFNMGNAGEDIRDKDGNPLKDMAGNVINHGRKPYQEGMIMRCNPDLSEMETLAWNFRNNWECNVDSFGTVWQSDNDDDGNKGVRINYVMEYGNYGYRDELTGDSWQKGDAKTEAQVVRNHWHQDDPGVVPNLLNTGAGSPTGILIYEGSLLPVKFQGQMIHADAGPNIVRSYPVTNSGAGYQAEIADILKGTRDRWYRPSDVCVAPDGSLFIADWYDPGVGGHAMGDLDHGRIYRLAPAASLNKYSAAKLNLTTADGALSALTSPNEATHYLGWQAIQQLGDKAVPALKKLASSASNPRHRARAIWALGKLSGKGSEAVSLALKDADANLRITGLRLARQLKLDLVVLAKPLVTDPSPQVRRELLITLRATTTPETAKIWSKLASQYDGKDQWYLAALGIGAQFHWDECIAAWQADVGEKWNTPAGRDIVWISRSDKSTDLISQVLATKDLPASEKLRFVRAFDYQSSEESRQAALKKFLMD